MSFLFSDQQTKLSSLLGDPNTSTDDQFPLALRKKELNRGEMRFAIDTKCLVEYTSGTVASLAVSLPSDWIETFVLYIINGSQFQKITNDREISPKDLERYGAYAGDVPFYYTWVFSGVKKIKFLASTGLNGKTYQLFYFKKPSTELSADSDTSLIDEEFREAPAYYAAAQLLKQIGKTDMANQFEAEYASIVSRAQYYYEKLYLNYDQPRPDLNIADAIIQDVQGGGYPI